MRNHLIAELEKIAADDPRVVVITGDLGYGVLTSFAAKFPGRCFNAGISEQNMTAVAAGLALEGNIAYTYSIGNFPVMRCLEQIRNCACYHNANVKIVAIGGGFVYGQLGMSHHATEDLAISRALPHMHVFCPADPDDAVRALQVVNKIDGPCYIRLARGGEPCLHPEISDYDVREILPIREGDHVAVLATGTVLAEAIQASDMLREQGLEIGVFDCISLKPFDEKGLLEIAQRYGSIISVEEHNVIGGLGSAIAESLLAGKLNKVPRLRRLGLQDVYTSVVGSQSYLRKQYGLSAADIVTAAREMCEVS